MCSNFHKSNLKIVKDAKKSGKLLHVKKLCKSKLNLHSKRLIFELSSCRLDDRMRLDLWVLVDMLTEQIGPACQCRRTHSRHSVFVGNLGWIWIHKMKLHNPITILDSKLEFGNFFLYISACCETMRQTMADLQWGLINPFAKLQRNISYHLT